MSLALEDSRNRVVFHCTPAPRASHRVQDKQTCRVHRIQHGQNEGGHKHPYGHLQLPLRILLRLAVTTFLFESGQWWESSFQAKLITRH